MATTTLTWPGPGGFRERVDGRRVAYDPGDTLDVDPEGDRYDKLTGRGWVEGEPEDVLPDDDPGGEAEETTVDTVAKVPKDLFVHAFVALTAGDQVEAIQAGDVPEDYLADVREVTDYATVEDAVDERTGG